MRINKKFKIRKTNFRSYTNDWICKGCQFCVKGRKLVLFITGICPRNCFYCPISDIKKNHDVIYANERPITKVSEAIEESILCESKGAGITGGDPLARLERTIKYIKTLKKKFGKDFHIHLYTSLDLVNENNLKRLFNAGLDEIRFHLDIDNDKLWPRLKLAKHFKWNVGVEIPVIPERKKQLIKLIKFIEPYVDFLNLNELEMSDCKSNKLLEMGFKARDNNTYAVKGSEELALKLLKISKVPTHFCTVDLKDNVQLANRIKLRAKNVATKFDIITKDGSLVRNVIYLSDLKPGFDYQKRIREISNAQKTFYLKKLNMLKNKIIKDYNAHNKNKINKKDLILDKNKLRLITSNNVFKNINVPNKAIVEEFPTFDSLEIEIEFLS
jgi:hypothetical protein